MALGSSFPVSYQDPLYATLARAAEAKFGLPTGILDAIRTRGERSNANQVSSAGAETPYQFIPSTRRGMINNYGTDPYADPSSATDAAAQLLLENRNRGGSWDKAIAMYSGGNHPGPSSYHYQARVGNFDNGDTSMPPYYPPQAQSLFPVVNGVDPLAPEAPTQPAPIPGSSGPSANVAATSPVAQHKRGGILGALESVFMPDPGSRWAGALRDGLFNAKESQQNYLEGQAGKMLNLATANQKLKQLQQHGEYQVVGNNVFHIKPDGTTEMITGPSGIEDKTKLIDLWQQRHAANPNDPTLDMLQGLILGGANVPSVIGARNAEQEKIARIRAGATTGAAQIRTNAAGNLLPPLPPGAKVIH